MIHVESIPGEGSEFTVLLPIFEGEIVNELKEPGAANKGSAAKSGKGHVLVVDDEVSLTKYYALALGKLGYSVTQSNDGQSALQLFKKQPDRFDIVFTDQTMPKMTGTQMSREILRVKPDIPIILATGFIGTVTEKELNELNFSSFLTKPIKISALISSIDQASYSLKKKRKGTKTDFIKKTLKPKKP